MRFRGTRYPLLNRSGNPLLTSLISYWKLDDLNDSHGTNTWTNTNSATFTAGKIGNAATIVRASLQHLDIVDNASLSTGDIDFTFACWIQLAAPGSTGAIVYKGTGSGAANFEWWIAVSSDMTAATFVVSNGATSAQVAGTITTAWHYVVVWHDSVANTINIQIDNGTPVSGAWANGSWDSGFPFRMAWDGSGRNVGGQIDEAAFWKRVLTSPERTRLYNGGNGLTHPFTG